MNNIKCVIFDVDGTLITLKSKILLDSTVNAIHQLQDKGIKVVIATGRPVYALNETINNRIKFDYFICSNGTYIFDNNKKVIYKHIISNEIIMKYTKLCDKTNSEALFQFEDGGYIYVGEDKLFNNVITSYGKSDCIIRHPSRIHHLKNTSNAIITYIEKEHLKLFENTFIDYDFIPYDKNFYDINPKFISKATGIYKICDDLNIDYKDTMAFGDALNDYEMVNEAGIGIAMGNALEKVKEVSSYVTEDSINHGVHNALVHFKLIEGEKY